MAMIKLQAEMSLTKSKAGLLCVADGLHLRGYLDDADYEVYKAKYSAGLLEDEPLTPKQVKERETKANRDRQLNRHYEEVLHQWPTLKDKTKEYHLKKAQEEKHLKYAKLVLEKGTQEMEAKK